MANQQQSINGLPGWIWVYKGEKTWYTKSGKASKERHAENVLTGETLSTGTAQRLANKNLAEKGKPKTPVIHRIGKTRTTYRKYKTGKYNYTTAIRFTDLDSAREWICEHGEAGELDKYKQLLIQVQYEKALATPSKGGNNYDEKGVAIISNYAKTVDFVVSACGNPGKIDPWSQAEANIDKFQMGENDRIIIYGTSAPNY